MPTYVFKHPSKNEFLEIYQKINDIHEYIDSSGLKWERVYCLPRISSDTKIDPYSSRAFSEKTNRKGTFGDLFDLSKEMSEKRGGPKNDPFLSNK
jgi:hypothetical protein